MLGVHALICLITVVLVEQQGSSQKILDAQSETESIDAFLRRVPHIYTDIDKD
jgi:hypothetical protein